MMKLFRCLATTIVVISLTSIASAQGTGGTTGGTGGTMSGIGGTTGNSSSTGQNSTGGSATGQSGAAGSGLSGNSSFAGTVPGQATTASNATDTFIGSNATTGFVGGASQAGSQQGTNRQFQALQNNQSQQSTSQSSATVRNIRTTLRVGFAFPSATQMQMQMTGSLANPNIASLRRFSPIRPELAGIDVALNSNGIAVLTGSAPTVETRRLAANLMRLQPGVRKVDNQIVVQAN